MSGPWRRVATALHVAWWAFCLLGLAVVIGGRWLRYASWSAWPPLDGWLAELMVLEGQAFLWVWAYGRLKIRIVIAAIVVLALALHRRLLDRLVARRDDAWRLRPITVSLLLGLMLGLHFLVDVNPSIALVGAASLVLAWGTDRVRIRGGGRLLLWVAFFAVCLAAVGDVADRLAVVVWAAVLAALHRGLGARLRPRDLALLRAAAILPLNLLPAVLPLALPLHAGTRLGDGLAYSFCEVPGRGTVHAAVPVCDSVRRDYADCRGSRVVEYDLATLTPVTAHDFFSPDFYGRLELLLCLDDEVQVTVQGAVHRGKPLVMSVLAFPVEAPEQFTPVFVADGLGATMAWDPERDQIFYSTEFTNLLVRYDRRTRQFAHSTSPALGQRWYEPVTLQEYSGSFALNSASIDHSRNRIYLADWMRGRLARAVDLTTLAVVARYDAGGGGSLGIARDHERDRLYVSSLWGIEVFDLRTDRLIARKRLGLGNRPVIVDAARNRLYVGSTVEGKIRILDRDTLAVLGQIPIGIGSRYPHLARDGSRLFASSVAAHYAFPAKDLASSGDSTSSR